jgi:ion channel POLLUX/CASTOR
MQKPSLRNRLQYYFENTMSAGASSVIKWLAIVSLFMVMILGLIILIFGIKSSPEPDAENLGFIEGAWQSLMATLDSGTMGGDEGWAFRSVRFIATLGGIFLISVLIGTISASIDEKLNELKKGKSKVLEYNHTLILGWSEKIFSIISELVIANESQKKPSIVILADRDKVEMEDEIKDKIENTKNTKIIVRSGNPLEAGSINIANHNDARSIIILSPEIENHDTHVIKSVLAITNGRNRREEPYHIVAEIREEKNMEAANLVGNDEAVFVLSDDLIARITAQTCRQSGLSMVYNDLLQYDGNEIYIQEIPELFGKTYKDAIYSFQESAIIGIYKKDDTVEVNPDMAFKIEEGDSLVILAEDDSTIKYTGLPNVKIDESLFVETTILNANAEKTIFLGWNERGKKIIRELDNYVAQGSEIVVMEDMEEVHEELQTLQKELTKLTIKFQNGNINDKLTLESLNLEQYDHIILLSKNNVDVQQSDARTLICLLHLRNISEKANKDFNIVSEMLDLKNRELGIVAKADDFIVSDNLISLMLTQLSENKQLKKVFDTLFAAEGSEIYLKPVSQYLKTGEAVNMYTILERVARNKETFIGYRIIAESRNVATNFGIVMNPNKSTSVTFQPDDMLIVVAED